MPNYSILLVRPTFDDACRVLLRELHAMLAQRGQPYEVVSFARSAADARRLEDECGRVGLDCVRIVSDVDPTAVGETLAAGIAISRGDAVVVVDGSGRYPANQLPRLLGKLARADLVLGRGRKTRWQKFAASLRWLPQRALLGLEVHDPEILFWAARREAVAELHLENSLYRFVATLVAQRGYRVGEVYVDQRSGTQRFGRTGALPRMWALWRVWRHRLRFDSRIDPIARDEVACLDFSQAAHAERNVNAIRPSTTQSDTSHIDRREAA